MSSIEGYIFHLIEQTREKDYRLYSCWNSK